MTHETPNNLTSDQLTAEEVEAALEAERSPNAALEAANSEAQLRSEWLDSTICQ